MKMQSRTILGVSPAVVALVALAAACSGSGDDGLGSINGTGSVQVLLTDAPLDLATVKSVNVTIDGVTVYGGSPGDGSGSGPIELMTHPETFDLLTLTGGATTLLAEGELSAGIYNRIRLHVPDATLEFLDGTVVDLKISSHKVDVPIPFEVGVGENLELTLDFQADASVQVNETGNDRYILRPVVTPVKGN